MFPRLFALAVLWTAFASCVSAGPPSGPGAVHQPRSLLTAYQSSPSDLAWDELQSPAPLPDSELAPAGCAAGAHSEACGYQACGDPGCASCCSLGLSLGDCCLGDPWTLRNALVGDCSSVDFGGWTQLGYHNDNTRFSTDFNDLFAFNDVPDQLNLQQQWLWFEKVAEAPACGIDWGFRFDIMYGADAQKTQAFGNDSPNWDASNGFDHGEYGWAMPQAYIELASGDWSVIAGHFFTLVGYEVVTAPDNFFYSHAYTMFNSEPFTHTGVLGTYTGVDNFEVYAGWTAGWDTGFDQALGGSSWLGGFSTSLSDDVTFTYISTAGNFGLRSDGNNGYSHSLVFDVTMSDKVNYVLQSDVMHYNDISDQGAGAQVGVNQYLFYQMSDCWSAGTRVEWWKSNGVTGIDESTSFYGATFGLNYKPHANLILRPELRYNWTPADDAVAANNNGENFNHWVFGVDAILTY